MSANGQLPGSELTAIGGGLFLRPDAAQAFLAMNAEAPVHVRDAYRRLGAPGDLARGTWSQWFAWERYQRVGAPVAAQPGTSNHGWGTAIDLTDLQDRATLDRIGAKYGFSKSWSDAPGEWWHILYEPGHFRPPPPDPYLRMPETVWAGPVALHPRAWAKEYDRLRATQTPTQHPNRARLAWLRARLKVCAGRCWAVAHLSRPPAWADARALGWQFQQYSRRSNGDQVI